MNEVNEHISSVLPEGENEQDAVGIPVKDVSPYPGMVVFPKNTGTITELSDGYIDDCGVIVTTHIYFSTAVPL